MNSGTPKTEMVGHESGGFASLERIYKSKKFVGRPKDIAHLPLLEQTMQLKRRSKRRG
jgi:hypothetical protein